MRALWSGFDTDEILHCNPGFSVLNGKKKAISPGKKYKILFVDI